MEGEQPSLPAALFAGGLRKVELNGAKFVDEVQWCGDFAFPFFLPHGGR